jgi:hypothetical protein
MAKLPTDAIAVKRALSRNPSHRLFPVAEKLLADTPPLVAMWRALEKREVRDNDPWVWGFLEASADAANLPPYHYVSANERRKLIKTITSLATSFAGMLETNRLDAHLIHSDGKIFNGYFFYEDFGEPNQARIDADGTNKLKVSVLIKSIADRAEKRITEEPPRGKTGTNVRAIRFVRVIAKRNFVIYREPLNAVTAAAANAIFGTSYGESDIRKLLSR